MTTSLDNNAAEDASFKKELIEVFTKRAWRSVLKEEKDVAAALRRAKKAHEETNSEETSKALEMALDELDRKFKEVDKVDEMVWYLKETLPHASGRKESRGVKIHYDRERERPCSPSRKPPKRSQSRSPVAVEDGD
jgi:hypothetical protein